MFIQSSEKMSITDLNVLCGKNYTFQFLERLKGNLPLILKNLNPLYQEIPVNSLIMIFSETLTRNGVLVSF